MPRQSLKQRADGRYRVKFQDKYFYGATQREAYAARDEYKRALEAGMHEESMGVTLQDYALRWVSTFKSHLSDNQYNTHIRNVNRLCAHDSMGSKRMRSIVPSDIQSFYNTYQGMSQSSINSMRDTVRGVFKGALADRVIQFDPTLALTLPKGTKGSHRSITPLEREVIHRTRHRLRPAVMTMLYAGLRRGEIIALDVDRDVDFEKRTITVRYAVAFDNQNHPVLKDPKTEAGERTIPLLDILANELRGIHGLVVTAAGSNDLMSESSWSRCWDSYISALETEANGVRRRWYGKTKEHKQILANGGTLPPFIDMDIRSHDLRHSFCTMLYEADVDLKSTMTWMGHADEEMTMQIYTHLSEEKERQAALALHKYANSQYQKAE